MDSRAASSVCTKSAVLQTENPKAYSGSINSQIIPTHQAPNVTRDIPDKETPTRRISQKVRTTKLTECSTPEMLVSLVITKQSDGAMIADIEPYYEKLGLTSDTILTALRNINTSVSQRVLAMYQLFQANPGQNYTFTEMANAFHIANETSRRSCYILTTLRLIQLKQSISGKCHRQVLCFYYNNSIAA